MRADSRPRPAWLRRALPALIGGWLVALGVGVHACHDYATSRGGLAPPPPRWPVASTLTLATGTPTAVMFVHPECPCTRISLDELAVARRQAGAGAVVIAIEPATEPGDDAEAWDRAGAIPGAIRVRDDGTEARRFGALTSGHLVVYGPDGALRFVGGVTAARGHAGDNVGRRAVIAALRGEAGAPDHHDVFGCALAALATGAGP